MTIELDSEQPGLQEQTASILHELALAGQLGPGQIVVIGTSTSEVAALGLVRVVLLKWRSSFLRVYARCRKSSVLTRYSNVVSI